MNSFISQYHKVNFACVLYLFTYKENTGYYIYIIIA